MGDSAGRNNALSNSPLLIVTKAKPPRGQLFTPTPSWLFASAADRKLVACCIKLASSLLQRLCAQQTKPGLCVIQASPASGLVSRTEQAKLCPSESPISSSSCKIFKEFRRHCCASQQQQQQHTHSSPRTGFGCSLSSRVERHSHRPNGRCACRTAGLQVHLTN